MSIANPKPVSLSVMPYQVSHLCFEVDGIVEISNVHLGDVIKPLFSPPPGPWAFDFPAFYAILGTLTLAPPPSGLLGLPTVPGDFSRLLYDFLQIEAFVAPSALVALRKESLKAALNKAIGARQNAYFSKYAKAEVIVSEMNQLFSPTWPGPVQSKPQLLQNLVAISNQQWQGLSAAYKADPVRNPGSAGQGVVTSTQSQLSSDTTGYGYSATGSETTGVVPAPK
jgi:hypothetical protein